VASAVSDEIEFHRVGEEWTAVYLNGELQRVGDSYLADEWLQEHAGVVVVENSPCMLDSHRAMPTLAEVRGTIIERDRKLAEAEKLRLDAIEMIKRATQLESEADR
jgi:hypothetical protein